MAVQDDARNQLGALPFGNIIGGPLVAAIQAQDLAAHSSLKYILDIGFEPPDNGNGNQGNGDNSKKTSKVRIVEFEYESDEGTKTLKVPLLALVPIPYIKIDDMTIQFKANISAGTAAEQKTDAEEKRDASLGISGSTRWGVAKVSANFNASYSAKKDSSASASSKYAVEYTMDVYVHASQEDIPKGMLTVLQIFNESINAQKPKKQDDKDNKNKQDNKDDTNGVDTNQS